MFPAKVKKLAEYFQKGGVYEVLLRLTAAEYLPGWLLYFNEAQIMRRDRLDPRLATHMMNGYEYGQVDRGAIDELLTCSGAIASSTRRRHFEEFFSHGARCHVMKHEGRIVAYSWTFEKEYVLTFDEYRRKNLVFALDGDTVFLGNVFVVPTHRRHGVFSHLFHRIVSRWPEGARFYSWAERANDGSLRAHGSVGFLPSIHVLCVTICGVTGYWTRAATEKSWRYIPREETGSLSLDRTDDRDGRQG